MFKIGDVYTFTTGANYIQILEIKNLKGLHIVYGLRNKYISEPVPVIDFIEFLKTEPVSKYIGNKPLWEV
jgi:hypothetical protein